VISFLLFKNNLIFTEKIHYILVPHIFGRFVRAPYLCRNTRGYMPDVFIQNYVYEQRARVSEPVFHYIRRASKNDLQKPRPFVTLDDVVNIRPQTMPFTINGFRRLRGVRFGGRRGTLNVKPREALDDAAAQLEPVERILHKELIHQNLYASGG